MAQQIGLPEWAAADTEVWFTSGSGGRLSRFVPAMITRVTKASVFIKVGTSTHERRFSRTMRSYTGETYMEEHGGRSADRWRSPALIWAKDSKHVADTQAERGRELILATAMAAADNFRTHESQSDTPRLERAVRAVEALQAYIEAEVEARRAAAVEKAAKAARG